MQLFNKEETRQKRRVLRKNETDAERRLWAYLRNRRISGFKYFRQYGIGSYIADFYCPELNLVVEIDGGQHYSDEGKAYDSHREQYMTSIGIRTIRFSNSDVLKHTEAVMKRLCEELRGKTNEELPQSLFRKEGGKMKRATSREVEVSC
jgi:very-short-patch-repair endonuclease